MEKMNAILGIMIGSFLLFMYLSFVATFLMQGRDLMRMFDSTTIIFLIGGVALIVFGILEWKKYKKSSPNAA